MNQTLSLSPAATPLSKQPPASVQAATILHVFPSFEVGGSQRRLAQLMRGLGPRYRHLIRSINGRTEAVSLLDASLPYEVQPIGFPRCHTLSNIHSARRQLESLRPDVLVTYNWGATEWAAANHPRTARHIHIEDGFGPEEVHKQFLRRRLFRRLVLNWHSTIVVPSLSLKRIALEEWHLDASRVRYIPNGINCRRFQRAPDLDLTARFRGHGPVIGTVATLRREKALDRLISAFALVRAHMAARLVIVGDGPERARLEADVTSRGLSDDVTFTGAIEAPERVLTGFDVFAVSSDTEQMPFSILEAMAAARPITSTDAGDIRAMVSEENRPFVVPKYDVALASMMMALLRDPGLRLRLGEANQARAHAHYDEMQMVSAYDRLFSSEDTHSTPSPRY